MNRANATVAFWLLPFFLVAGCQKAPRSEAEAPAQEPAPVALRTLTEGQGPPVVMLGGGTGGAAAFAPHAQALAKDFRVVRPQSLRIERAQSKQPLPPGYAIKTESAALARSLDQLGLVEPVDLAGHSFGALVALDFALDRPDRVRTLVLAEPPAFWVVPPEEFRTAEEMRGMVELLRTFGPVDEPTDEQLVQFQSRLGRKEVKPPAPAQPGWADWVSRRSALRGLSAVANHTDEPGRLTTLRVPVLIVTGKDTVEFHRRINDILAASLPVAERVELTGGHGAPVAARDEFVSELRAFLARHRDTRQAGANPGPAPDPVEAEIKRLEQLEAKAFLERDIPTLSKLWDAKYVVNNPDNKIVAGVSPKERPGLQKPRSSFTREVERLTVRGDLVISMGGETIVPGDGEPHAGKTVHRRYTHVWQRVEGEWKLIARHSNVSRIDP